MHFYKCSQNFCIKAFVGWKSGHTRGVCGLRRVICWPSLSLTQSNAGTGPGFSVLSLWTVSFTILLFPLFYWDFLIIVHMFYSSLKQELFSLSFCFLVRYLSEVDDKGDVLVCSAATADWRLEVWDEGTSMFEFSGFPSWRLSDIFLLGAHMAGTGWGL